MESFVEEGSHDTSPQLATSKQTSVEKKARFEAGPTVLRPQPTLVYAEGRSDAMALTGSSDLVASGLSSSGSSKRYSRESIASVVPSNILLRYLLTFCLQTVIAALEAGDLDQVNRLCEAADLDLDICRVGEFDLSVFRTIFDNIYHVVDTKREASATDDVSVL